MNEPELVRRGGASYVLLWLIVALTAAGLLREGGLTGAVRWPWLIAVVGSMLIAGVAVFVSVVGERPRAAISRAVASVTCGVWTGWIAAFGWSWTAVILFAFGALAFTVAERYLAPPVYLYRSVQQQLPQAPAAAPATSREAFWADALRRALKQPVPVLSVTPWEGRPNDGERIVIELPDDKTLESIAYACPTIAARARLRPGCTIRALTGDHQGLVVLDAMLRDCLADETWVTEDTTASSIYEPIPLARTPRGEYVEATLREKSMLVGGMPGAGKTTFLHRLIMRMARWTDTLIWVADLNGGGLAWPWVEAWARGQAIKPTVDWVATNAYEAAVMVAVAQAIAKDRKISPEARKRRKTSDNDVLPVDEKLPAIVIVSDEGAEFAQSTALIVRLARNGITRVAQIARAEGIRVVMSVLRGTSDLLDRALKTAMGVLVCLRMMTKAEYPHILEAEPRYTGPMHNGSTFVRLPEQGDEVIHTRTDRVSLSMIDRHSIATAHLRPDLDERAQKVAARVTVRDVLDDKDPRDFSDIARHPIMRDVEAGRAYSGRWERVALKLAEMRGEDVPEFTDEPQRVHVPDRPTVAAPGSMLESFLIETGVFRDPEPAPGREPAPERERVPVGAGAPAAEPGVPAQRAPEHRPGSELVPVSTPAGTHTTVRDLIVMVLRQDGAWLTAADIRHRIADDTGAEVTKQRAAEVLGSLVKAGEVERDETGVRGPYYRMAV